jgi:hypothetical protein
VLVKRYEIPKPHAVEYRIVRGSGFVEFSGRGGTRHATSGIARTTNSAMSDLSQQECRSKESVHVLVRQARNRYSCFSGFSKGHS